MSVQFILGRAGSGKTQYLLGQMIEQIKTDPLGPPIYWLLPRQATFQAQRLLTATLGGFSRVRVVSFDDLGKEILTHCGDVDIPEVTTTGRRMVIGHLLRRHQKQLKFYSLSAHKPGLSAELDSTFGEFERAGLDVAALDELRTAIAGDDRAGPALLEKLADLHLLLDEYNKYIGQERLDPQRRMSLILKRVSDCSLLKDAQLFVDDFFDFSANERKLLVAIAGIVPRTVISLLIDPDSDAVKNPGGILADLSVFHRTERTYQSLLSALNQAAVAVDAPVLLRGNHRCQSPDLLAIESGIFSAGQESVPISAVESFDAPDVRGEVDAVARRIRSAVAKGLRYRQIGVLVRDLSGYQEIINASFTEHGLPYFADHRRTAGHHPLLQLVRAALLIARHGWPHEAVLTLIKSGLSGLTDDQADELENYVLRHRIRGRMWESDRPWEFGRQVIRTGDESPALSDRNEIDQLRRSLAEKLRPLLDLGIAGTTWKIADIATRIFAVVEAFEIRPRLLEWMSQAEAANDLERRGEHEQVWSEFVQLFDHMVDLLGNESISLSDFIAVLDSGLESFDLAMAPPKVDQILVGQIDRTRPPELKMVFVLGLNEGAFPLAENERCVISDRERRTLRARNVDLDQDSQRQLLDERFLAYLAFTRASERLIISRTAADAKGRSANPSSFWMELFRVLPGLAVEHISDARQIGTARQLTTGLLRWVRAGGIDDGLWPSLYQWLTTQNHEPRLTALLSRAWSSLRYDNVAKLEADLGRQLFRAPLYVRVNQLESMAACPFQHFAKYGLALRGREKADVTGLDLSNAYHDILANLVGDLLSTNKDWCAMQPGEAKEMIRVHAAEIGRRLRGELMLSSARNRYLLDRIERTLEQACAAMMEMNRRGKYRPAHAALKFGEGETLPAYQLETPKGQAAQLHGQIDRVDFNDKKAAFVVVDYKMGVGALAMDRVYHGLSLQLLTYLLVIQANGEQLAGRKLTPAAAFLLQLLRSPQSVDHPSEAISPDDADYHLRVKPRGVIEARAVKSLDLKLTEGASSVVGAYIKKDGTLGLRNVSDVADQAEFEALLQHVEQRLGELADEVISGDVSVAPYMIARQTPCPHCEFRSVCRFEPGINRYRMLPAMKREDVLKTVSGVAE
jgi:ATP-dependent helicase/nuclease subunit B